MKKDGFLDYVHSFRGFAILNIVAIHALAIAIIIPVNFDPDPTAPMYVFNEMLFHDSTLYFAMISGLLFSSILRSRGYRRFYQSKMVYVLSPYVFCTVVFSVLRWNTEGTGLLALPPDISDYLGSIVPNLLSGEAQFTYWYIPVLLFMFAITPLLSILARAKSWAAVPVWIIMLLPLVFSRPVFEEGVNQVNAGTLIYFTGAYTLGLYLGDRLEARLDAIALYRKPLLAVAVVTSLVLVILGFTEINRFGFFSLQESIFYVQKLCLAALVLLWLRGLGENQPRWLTTFANEAFTIYFLHICFMLLLAEIFWKPLHNTEYQPLSIYLSGPIYFAVALTMSMLVVYLVRLVFGKRSRMLIGS
jgi:surface polysaccharide O-acyltransferase-like enzyme